LAQGPQVAHTGAQRRGRGRGQHDRRARCSPSGQAAARWQ